MATVDGRVFKWGLNRAPRSSSGKERNRDEERRGGADRDLSEEDGTVALEALVPRQVAGIGMEVSPPPQKAARNDVERSVDIKIERQNLCPLPGSRRGSCWTRRSYCGFSVL